MGEKEEKDIPLNCDMDANRWASEFIETLKKGDLDPTDHSWMLSWFANAIMCGWDNAHWKIENEQKESIQLIKMSANRVPLKELRDWLTEIIGGNE